MLPPVLVLILGLVVLGFSAHYLVNSSIHIARALKIPEILIGLTIVAAGTSAPEIAVSVTAAMNGEGALSVGNVIGSNIFNLGFILGIIAVLHPQKINKKMVYRDGVVLFVSTLLILLFIWNQFVSLWEGLIMLGLLVLYNIYLFAKKETPTEIEEADMVQDVDTPTKWYHFVIFIVSLLFLVKSADYVVEAAVEIASSFGLSEWAIGATIVAAGTSLPEVATSIIATIKKRFDIAVGNVVGSDIFNALGIIGISSVVAPLTLESKTIFGMPDNVLSMILLSATIVLVMIFMRTGWTLGRREGAILLVISLARMGFEVYIGS